MTKLTVPSAYSERVLPSLSFYLAALFVPAALFLVALPFSEIFPFVVAAGSYFTIILVTAIKAPKISIGHARLKVGTAAIALSALGTASSIEREDQFSEKSHKLSPFAFTKFQIGIKGLVKIEVNDPADPTPYWLVSTRHPEVVVAYLNAKR